MEKKWKKNGFQEAITFQETEETKVVIKRFAQYKIWANLSAC